MTRFFFFFFSFFSFSILFGQTIQPSLLEEHRKKICLKETKTPYSGTIEGYVNSIDLHPVHKVMFVIKGCVLSSNYLYCDSVPLTVYIKGASYKGKSEGVWKFYQFKDSILLAECSFVDGKFDGKLIIYDVYNIGEHPGFIDYYRKGKFLYFEWLY